MTVTLFILPPWGHAVVHGQSPPPSPPAYATPQLHCARFAETSRSDTETETARGAVKATTERDGIWSFRARDSGGGISLEAWYDSLSLRRRGAESEVSADTDGLIGGRYRGLLRPSGAYTELVQPFVPDEVAEVADLAAAARDLLPPLPPVALGPGESWRDAGIELTRLPDTTVAGRSLRHYRLDARAEASQAMPHGDTVPVPLRQTTAERGDIYWSPVAGLVRRTRDITVDATIPSGGRIRQPVRSRVVQRVELTRLPSQPACK
jgi:hypothetical protein